MCVDVNISTDEIRGFGALAPLSARAPSLNGARAESSLAKFIIAETGLIHRFSDPKRRDISVYLVWCDALLAVASRLVLFYVCLRSEISLPSLKLQSCETLIVLVLGILLQFSNLLPCWLKGLFTLFKRLSISSKPSWVCQTQIHLGKQGYYPWFMAS